MPRANHPRAIALLLAVVLTVGAAPVAARDLVDTGGLAHLSSDDHEGTGQPGELHTTSGLKLATGAVGWDISYPQCDGRYPRNGDFRIVGVNGGLAFSTNPCLAAGGDDPSQLRWAGRWAQLYMNTGNPRPRHTERWPIGQAWPRRCTAAQPNSSACSYDYGWNAAKDAYRTALRAYVSLGWAEEGARRIPVRNRWWLDVETANSWRANRALNVSSLRGVVAYLESRDVRSIGFYSAPHMWTDITGNTTAFAGYPSWVAGASTLDGAKRRCAGSGFTGGGVWLTQFFKNGFDADYAC